MTYKAFIFDVDGTLVRARSEYRYKIVGETLQLLNTSFSEKDIDRFWFEGDRDQVITGCFSVKPNQFWEVFRELDSPELRKSYTEPYDDIDFIQELREKGYKTGIVTGAPLEIASMNIDLIGKDNFDAIIIAFGSNGIKQKPHPHGLQECLGLLEVDKSEAIYIGNANEDIATAKNAQVLDVLISRGEYEFPDLNPSLKIYSLYELRQFIRE